MKKSWDLKIVLSNLEAEGQGHGIIIGVTRLLLLWPFYYIAPYWGLQNYETHCINFLNPFLCFNSLFTFFQVRVRIYPGPTNECIEIFKFFQVERNSMLLFDEKNTSFSLVFTGKSLSEVLIYSSINPQYDNRLFNDLRVQYKKITRAEHVKNMLFTQIV